jgi:hypothetical protein
MIQSFQNFKKAKTAWTSKLDSQKDFKNLPGTEGRFAGIFEPTHAPGVLTIPGYPMAGAIHNRRSHVELQIEQVYVHLCRTRMLVCW